MHLAALTCGVCLGVAALSGCHGRDASSASVARSDDPAASSAVGTDAANPAANGMGADTGGSGTGGHGDNGK